jgi:aerobic-type carbon monoxide dehydrogenase small subunit (CoxS/CutS family)
MFRVTELNVNGTRHRVDVNPEQSLLQVLRDELDLTGSKYGCGEGRCGACTVLIDGQPTRSCITKVGTVADRPIRTIEGVEQNGRLHPLQEAFLEADALQCGYCTSGMIMSAMAVLGREPGASAEDIRRSMNGNICRCGTYSRILAAIHKASLAMKEARRD